MPPALQTALIALLLVSPLLFVGALFWAIREWRWRRRVESRFAPVVDVERELQAVQEKARRAEEQLSTLKSSYIAKKALHDRLVQQVVIFEDKLDLAEVGVYEPHFDFTDSEEYKRQIAVVRDEQKIMIFAKTAVVCQINWSVDGSRSKGETMVNRNIRLTLRAFNNECEAAIANARWNNVNSMEKRIVNAKKQIDGMNESNKTIITDGFMRLKLKELYLTHEYREKLKHEKDERAELARAAREEQKLQRDIEKAQDDEAHYQRLLDKARTEASRVSGEKLRAFEDQVRMLEKDLADAHARAERAQAMAERTKSGYVYIISNVGAFGPEMVKIGLTRRLDPADRIRELGDASVPFFFDTHAIIYSDDAPALERALHAEFESVRVNIQNLRKEFFRASIEDVEVALKRLAPQAPFFRDVEAQEYRETLARRREALAVPQVEAFPAEL